MNSLVQLKCKKILIRTGQQIKKDRNTEVATNANINSPVNLSSDETVSV